MTKHVKLLGQKFTVASTHLLEWPKSRTLTTSKAGVGMEHRKLLFTAGENAH